MGFSNPKFRSQTLYSGLVILHVQREASEIVFEMKNKTVNGLVSLRFANFSLSYLPELITR